MSKKLTRRIIDNYLLFEDAQKILDADNYNITIDHLVDDLAQVDSLTLLRKANADRQKLWDPEKLATPLFRATELGGEAGEALNEVKKLEREKMGFRGSRTTVEKLADELADVIICADLVAAEYGIDLAEAVKRKFNETSDKVGFDIKL